MTGFGAVIGDWGHALAAAAFAALAIVAARRRQDRQDATQRRDRQDALLLAGAMALTALWALQTVIASSLNLPAPLIGGIAETLRNGAWVVLIWHMARRDRDDEGAAMPRGSNGIIYALALTFACQFLLDLMLAIAPTTESAVRLVMASWLVRATSALAAIMLAHGLFAALSHRGAARHGWLAVALTAMWAYDVHHYLLAWFSDGRLAAFGNMRGVIMAAIAPLFILSGTNREARGLTVSRRAAYQAAALGIGLLYAVALFIMTTLARSFEDPVLRIAQIAGIFGLSVIGLILFPSAAFRAWLRMAVAKHLFTHRYDYRTQWIGFAEAMGGSEDETADDRGAGSTADRAGAPLNRAARAMAQAVSAPAALLFTRGGDGGLIPSGAWRWSVESLKDAMLCPATAAEIEAADRIRDLTNPASLVTAGLPDLLRHDPRCWALVPLRLRGALIGAVLIARPPGRDRPDWEDVDMLRAAAVQLAVTISEWHQREALAEAERFDEFNRRFAFIMHDIKNMVSQISLLAANAGRHADNPAFRADMVLTLKETADRMNGLITRLGRAESPPPPRPAICDLAALTRRIAGSAMAGGRVRAIGEDRLMVRCDPERLEQAIGHLVQNALDATPPDGAPVRIICARMASGARLDIIDAGRGMSAAFMRDELFRPFSSTKAAGFGIGAHEARAIITAMGGTVSVDSREGDGTRFTLSLPLSADHAQRAGANVQKKAG